MSPNAPDHPRAMPEAVAPTQLPRRDEGRQSLADHARAKGHQLYERYGPHIGWPELQRILEDRSCVRYPTQLVFDATSLDPGEFAHPFPLGPRPEDGFLMRVHPHFATQRDQVPLLVLYQLVLVNYGRFASAADAECFGAAALGLDCEEYYQALCRMADAVGRGHQPPCRPVKAVGSQ